MPFPRIQGNKLFILHSKRADGQVKQIKLHAFDTFSDAQNVVNSDIKWKVFCETLTLQSGIKFNKERLRETIRAKLDAIEFDDTNPIDRAVLQVLVFLKNCQPPLFPKQMQILNKTKKNLLELRDIVDKKLALLEEPMNLMVRQKETDADKCLDLGLGCYERGEWDEARQKFIQGLKTDPNHVDLLRICVTKSWYYRKRLFISGEIEI